MKKYRELDFMSAADTYNGNRSALLGMMAFITLVAGLILYDAVVALTHGTVKINSWIITPILFGIFALIMRAGLKDIARKWPVCKKHKERLKITRREKKERITLMTFTCPKGDSETKLLWIPRKKRRNVKYG